VRVFPYFLNYSNLNLKLVISYAIMGTERLFQLYFLITRQDQAGPFLVLYGSLALFYFYFLKPVLVFFSSSRKTPKEQKRPWRSCSKLLDLLRAQSSLTNCVSFVTACSWYYLGFSLNKPNFNFYVILLLFWVGGGGMEENCKLT